MTPDDKLERSSTDILESQKNANPYSNYYRHWCCKEGLKAKYPEFGPSVDRIRLPAMVRLGLASNRAIT